MMQPNADSKNTYQPVSCDLSDELEAISMHKKSVNLKVQEDNGETVWKQGQIADLFAQDHADFLKLVDGTVIRLDKILDWRTTN
jgi:Rho-binding antiterminator